MLHEVHRRSFLATAALTAGGLMQVGNSRRAFSAEPEKTVPRPCPPSAWRKDGIVLPAAGGSIQTFTCAAEPQDDGSWRLWYTQRPTPSQRVIGVAEGRLGEPFRQTHAVVSAGAPADAPLSIGNLPEGWNPVQPVHLHLKNGRHRLYFWAHGPKVVRYLIAESDDGRRYKVLDPARPCLYHPGDRAVDGKTAAEAGISRMAKKVASRPETEPPAPVLQVSNDATNVYQLAAGSFEMYSVGLVEVGPAHPGYMAHDNCRGWLRVIDYYRSGDGLIFPDRRRVIVADAQDPPDMQFYYLAVNHTPQGRMGMLGHYRAQAQTMDLEWCFSQDGVHWQRPLRTPWIPRGAQGDPDCYGLYACHALARQGNRWHLFYTGTNAAHNHKHSYGPEAQVVMHASCETPWA